MKNTDLTLEELLNDPVIQLVMASDGVKSADIHCLANHVRERDDHSVRCGKYIPANCQPVAASLAL